VSERGYKCFACGAQGGLGQLAEHLGVAPSHRCSVAVLHEGIKDTHFSLDVYAKAKRLPTGFLASLGLHNRKHRGEWVVVIPYYDQDGVEVARRYRLALVGERRFAWAARSKIIPYGLNRLGDARRCGYVVLVEG